MIKKNSKSNHLTGKEYEIMKILWASDRPLLIADLVENCENIAFNSLHPTIKKLIEKGFIKIVGNMRVVKTLSRLYAPNVSVDEYAAMQLDEIMRATNKKLNLNNVMTSFTKIRHNNRDEILSEITEFVKTYSEEKN